MVQVSPIYIVINCFTSQKSPSDQDRIEILPDRDAEKILPYEADDSPFPEVRAVIQPVNDLTLPVNTVRMWTIGILFTIVSIMFYATGKAAR